jgi:hypothetical protein
MGENGDAGIRPGVFRPDRGFHVDTLIAVVVSY